jgi:lysophospholipase L1-like esterase
MPAKSRPLTPRVLPWLVPALLAVVAPAAAQPAPGTPAAPPRLELQRGDRVILVGNTLAERQQHFNHFETSLLARYPALELSVRNLGWSADTLTLQPRPLNFGDAATHLATQKADVILAFFGLNESFAGEAGLASFERDLEAYVTAHRAARYNGRTAPRLALVSPIAHERLPRLVHVDAEARNRELARYTEAMRRVAARLQVPFADVFTPTRQAMAAAAAPLTINGIHLTAEGDRVFAGLLLAALGLGPPAPAAASKAYEDLRALVHQKNQLFFYRFRPLNAEYVVGRRVDPFGSVSFPPEMTKLDEMIAEREQKIWKQARNVARGAAGAAAASAARGPS